MVKREDPIIVTGAAGFIGSYFCRFLQDQGFEHLIGIDDFSRQDKESNWKGIEFRDLLSRDLFWDRPFPKARAFFHLGARTDTMEMDPQVHEKWNLSYSQRVWNHCTKEQIPLIYASSAATYGDGAQGYSDQGNLDSLRPLNPYGQSKQDFDLWARDQAKSPPFWAGIKFFNVYGPGESHKGRMASVLFHAFHQIQSTGSLRLFRSHHPNFADGEQIRDFIYVKDIARLLLWIMETQPESGIYNGGTGKGRSFNDLAKAVFDALGIPRQIQYIDTPLEIRDRYQYFTQARTEKLRQAGFDFVFTELEDGARDYMRYLLAHKEG